MRRMEMKPTDVLTKKLKKFAAALAIACAGLLFFPTGSSMAATSYAKDAFRQELRQMIYDVDTSTHDISSYKLSASEVLSTFQGIKTDPVDKWMVAAYYSNLTVSYSYSGFYVKTVSLENVDDEVLRRYENLKKNVAKIKAGIEPEMKQLDKVIYLHDSIVDLVTYKFVAYQSYGAGGVFGDKLAVCSGYTKALNLLLEDQGFEVNYISSKPIDHAWTSIKLDGSWYHIDSTWDDTRSGKSGQAGHNFLLRNDAEFVTNDKNSHVSWVISGTNTNNPSTSTRFSKWYVHNIVGKMAFEDGYWYYVDTKTNSIMRNTAEGGQEKVMLNGTGLSTITLIDATDAGITYKISGVTKTMSYDSSEEKKPVDEKPPVVETPVVNPDDVTSATYYIMLEGSTSYISVGTGSIAAPDTSKDKDEVNKLIVSTPDISKYLGEDQVVEWNLITKSGAGKYFVKGNVKTVEPTVTDDDIDNSEEIETTVATYYIMMEGSTSYTNVGLGSIAVPETSKDKDEVENNIVTIPDLSKFLQKNQGVEWTAITKSGAGKFFVKGTVKTIQ